MSEVMECTRCGGDIGFDARTGSFSDWRHNYENDCWASMSRRLLSLEDSIARLERSKAAE